MCREHAAQLRGLYPDITAAGGDVIVIGTGNVNYARDLKEKLDLPFPVLVDEHGAAARAAALRKMPIVKLLSPGPWMAMVRAMRRGHKGGKPGAAGKSTRRHVRHRQGRAYAVRTPRS